MEKEFQGEPQVVEERNPLPDSPDETQEQRTQFAAARLHPFGKFDHGLPQQEAEVGEVRALIGAGGLVKLLQEQNPQVPALDHVSVGRGTSPCRSSLPVFIVIIVLAKLLL